MPRAILAQSAHADRSRTMSSVSDELGVSPSTLRTWERRYGLGPAQRETGERRRYQPEDVDRLRAMIHHVRAGMSAAEAAKHMIELLKGKKGSVGMVCHDSTSTTGKQRCEGFKEYFMANAPADLKLLDEQIAGEVTKAADTSKAIIQANDDIVGMYGSNEAAASGIVQGSQETGKDVTVVGFDSGKTQIDAIKAGTEAGAVTQSPVKIGYYTVKAAVAAINGAKLPTVIDSGFAWYDKNNIDDAGIKANLYE